MNYPTRIVALDLETTGTNSQYDYINQIGAVVMENGEIIGDPFYSYIQPNLEKLSIKGGALAAQCGDLTTDDGAAKAAEWFKQMGTWPASRDVASAFAEWAKDHAALPVVAHNATFDMAFVGQWMFQQRSALKAVAGFGAVSICTLQLAKQVWPGGASYALDVCLTLAGIEKRPAAHDALQDAILAGRLYHAILEELKNQ